jgi:translation initiation factor IF-2
MLIIFYLLVAWGNPLGAATIVGGATNLEGKDPKVGGGGRGPRRPKGDRGGEAKAPSGEAKAPSGEGGERKPRGSGERKRENKPREGGEGEKRGDRPSGGELAPRGPRRGGEGGGNRGGRGNGRGGGVKPQGGAPAPAGETRA